MAQIGEPASSTSMHVTEFVTWLLCMWAKFIAHACFSVRLMIHFCKFSEGALESPKCIEKSLTLRLYSAWQLHTNIARRSCNRVVSVGVNDKNDDHYVLVNSPLSS